MMEVIDIKRKAYFTFVPSRCGFTDNLERFDVSYRLGISLGFAYAHTPLNTPRTSGKIDDYLGFSDYFPIKIEDVLLENCQVIKIDLFSLLKDFNFVALADLQNFLLEFVSNSNTGKKEVALVSFSISKRNLIPGEPFVIEILKTLLIGQPSSSRLDYRSIFFRASSRSHHESLFTPGKLKLLVHIRQGDTAIIKTPWQTYIPLEKLKRKRTVPYEFFDRKNFESRSIDAEVFYGFLQRLFAYFDESNYSLIVSSDGYKRGFRKIYHNQDLLGLTRDQIRSLKNAERLYNQEIFSIFDDFEDCQCLIGETDENLFDLIHSILCADIILVGTQQRMIPKLLSFYSDEGHHPILIFLHTSNNLPIVEGLNVNPARCININVEHHDYEDDLNNLHRILTEDGI